MEKKYQVYLASFLMYVISGFAGYIYQASSYWTVALLVVLATLFMVASFLGLDEESKNSTKVQWISACSFAFIELVLTVCIEIIKLPFVGIFKYVNYGVQIAGILFIMYLVIYLVFTYTNIKNTFGEVAEIVKKTKSKKEKAEVLESKQESEVAVQVEETIKEETPVNEEEFSMEDIEIVGQAKETETEVLGIEFKEEEEIETPYMEEEL